MNPLPYRRLVLPVLAMLLVYVSIDTAYASRSYIISSGSMGGNYYQAGQVLAEKLSEMRTDIQFASIESNGSNENIANLKTRFADFAIVQRNILLNSLYNEQNGLRNVQILLPLFQEKFIIYAHSSEPTSFDTFAENVEAADKINIGVTSRDGYSYETFTTVTKILGVNTRNITYRVDSYSALIEMFNNKEIDYLVTFSLPIEAFAKADDVSLVYFNTDQLSLIHSRIHHLSDAFISSDSDERTLGSWAFLIGLSSSIKAAGGEEMVRQLISMEPDDYITSEIINSIDQLQQHPEWGNVYFAAVPLHKELKNILGIKTEIPWAKTAAAIFMLLLLAVLIYRFSVSSELWGLPYLWHRFRHIFFGIAVMILLYLLCIEILLWGEEVYFEKLGFKGEILDMTKQDLHFWVLIRNFTLNDLGVFPLSPIGKLMVSFSAYILYAGTMLIALSEYMMYRLVKRKKSGLVKITKKNHIVIAGWNDSTSDFIREIFRASKDYHGIQVDIVCIVPNSEKILNENEYIDSLVSRKKLSFVSGYVRNERVLEMANIQYANTVLLLAEDNTKNADERTLLRALTISKYCKEKASEKSDQPVPRHSYQVFKTTEHINTAYIIAQVNSDEFTEDLKSAGVNGIVNTAMISNGIVIQSMLNHGVSKLLGEVLFHDEHNEFYTVDLVKPKNSQLRGKTFDELLFALRKQSILLIAIRVVFHDKNGREIVDEIELKKLLNEEGLSRQVIVNPITKTELKRETDEDDQLLVFAVNRKELEKGIEKVMF